MSDSTVTIDISFSNPSEKDSNPGKAIPKEHPVYEDNLFCFDPAFVSNVGSIVKVKDIQNTISIAPNGMNPVYSILNDSNLLGNTNPYWKVSIIPFNNVFSGFYVLVSVLLGILQVLKRISMNILYEVKSIDIGRRTFYSNNFYDVPTRPNFYASDHPISLVPETMNAGQRIGINLIGIVKTTSEEDIIDNREKIVSDGKASSFRLDPYLTN